MKPVNHYERTKAKQKFATVFGILICFIFIICSAFWSSLPVKVNEENILSNKILASDKEQLFDINNMLQMKFIQLQQFVEVNKQNLESEAITDVLNTSESNINKTIDSINGLISREKDKNYKSQLFLLTDSYKQQLNYFSSLVNSGKLKHNNQTQGNIANKNNDRFGALQAVIEKKELDIIELHKKLKENELRLHSSSELGQQIISLQKNNQDKDAQIKILQKQLNSAQSISKNSDASQQQLSLLKKDIQLKSALISNLQKELASNKTTATLRANSNQSLAALQNEIQIRDGKIKSLQNQLNVYKKSTGSDLPSSNLSVEEENKFLKWALRSQVAISDNLTKQLNKLKSKTL